MDGVSPAGTAGTHVLPGGNLCEPLKCHGRLGREAPNWCRDIPWAGICCKTASGRNSTQELGDDEFFTGLRSYKGVTTESNDISASPGVPSGAQGSQQAAASPKTKWFLSPKSKADFQ